jgi:Spy/CpxP family protein refolding chaperone
VIDMSRSSSARARVAALAALALWAVPALAQAPAGKAPAAARAAAKQAAPPAQLWWNDAYIVGSLSLTGEQRKKMDELFAKRPIAAPPGVPGAAAQGRVAYLAALRAGNFDDARKQLAAWAAAEDRALREAGELRIEVLSVLTPEQRALAGKLRPELINVPWIARSSWQPRTPQPPGAKRPAPAPPAPAPAPKPPAP